MAVHTSSLPQITSSSSSSSSSPLPPPPPLLLPSHQSQAQILAPGIDWIPFARPTFFFFFFLFLFSFSFFCIKQIDKEELRKMRRD